MHFFSKTTVALTVALAAFSEAASHGRHRYRHFNHQVSVPLSTGYPAPTSTVGEAPAQKPVDTASAEMTSIHVPMGTGTHPKPSQNPSVTVVTSTVTYTLGPSNSVTTYTFTTTASLALETRTVSPVSSNLLARFENTKANIYTPDSCRSGKQAHYKNDHRLQHIYFHPLDHHH